MTNVIKFYKDEALVLDDNFCPNESRELLIDKVLKIKDRKEADRFIVGLYNEGALYGNIVENDFELIRTLEGV